MYASVAQCVVKAFPLWDGVSTPTKWVLDADFYDPQASPLLTSSPSLFFKSQQSIVVQKDPASQALIC